MLWEAVLLNWDLAVAVLVPAAIAVGLFTYIKCVDLPDYDHRDSNRF